MLILPRFKDKVTFVKQWPPAAKKKKGKKRDVLT